MNETIYTKPYDTATLSGAGVFVVDCVECGAMVRDNVRTKEWHALFHAALRRRFPS